MMKGKCWCIPQVVFCCRFAVSTRREGEHPRLDAEKRVIGAVQAQARHTRGGTKAAAPSTQQTLSTSQQTPSYPLVRRGRVIMV